MIIIDAETSLCPSFDFGQGPTLTLSVPSVDFGLMKLGEQTHTAVLLTNVTQLEASWTLKERCDSQQDHQDAQVLHTVEGCSTKRNVCNKIKRHVRASPWLRSQWNQAEDCCSPWPLAGWRCDSVLASASGMKQSWSWRWRMEPDGKRPPSPSLR